MTTLTLKTGQGRLHPWQDAVSRAPDRPGGTLEGVQSDAFENYNCRPSTISQF
jgi:hypothetical protein